MDTLFSTGEVRAIKLSIPLNLYETRDSNFISPLSSSFHGLYYLVVFTKIIYHFRFFFKF